jgi:ABC-type transport system involved in multi-copper enzyme maturation permease subunit
VLTCFCVVDFLYSNPSPDVISDTVYYGRKLHNLRFLLGYVWALSIPLLAMGGLLREKLVETSSITLALPVTRRQIMISRMGIALLQSVALAVVPWVAISAAMAVSGQPLPLHEMMFHLSLLVAGGPVFLALAVLVASTVSGEYTALAGAYGAAVAFPMLWSDIPSIRPFNWLLFVTGEEYTDGATSLLTGPIPVAQMVCYLLAAILLFVLSIRIVENRDF